jgi:hypothetical protein
MNLKTISLLCLTLVVHMAEIRAQQANYSPELWTVIENRWRESQPVIVVYKRSGEVVAGQQIHAGFDSLYIYPVDGLPVGTQWADDLEAVYMNEIDSVLFQEGGNKLGRDKRSKKMVFPSANARYSELYLKLRKASVYEDSLIVPLDLEMAVSHSRVMKQAFRKKRVRYSIGVNFGSDVILNEIQNAIGESSLPYSYDSYGGNVNGELLDLSFRFFDRLIIGGSLFSRSNYTNVYGYSNNSAYDINYNYMVDYVEHRLYAEYALLNTDRYYSRKFEVIAGAGLLLGNPEWRFGYSYYEVQNPDYESNGYFSYSYSDNLLGLQLTGAFHYYFFPGLSIWTAIDLNLNQPFVVPEQELPTSGEQEPFILPEHELGFSCVRFKLGLSIYF